MNILIIEDEQDLLDVYLMIFKKHGFTVDGFSNSADAKAEILSDGFNDKYQLVIADNQMPQISGVELAKVAFDHSVKTRFILVTGDRSLVDGARLENVVKIFEKPINYNSIIESVKEILQVK
ncbi:MAG: DNA-binding NtrC family response regulator [Thermoproteota archaeon]|jgi:DNA-binding NtrC family response regulator